MDYANPDVLVESEWLAANLDESDIRVVNATWYLPTAGQDPRAEHEVRHIPGAVFFDIDDICAPDSALPHMLPTAEIFAAKVGGLAYRLAITASGVALGLFGTLTVWTFWFARRPRRRRAARPAPAE